MKEKVKGKVEKIKNKFIVPNKNIYIYKDAKTGFIEFLIGYNDKYYNKNKQLKFENIDFSCGQSDIFIVDETSETKQKRCIGSISPLVEEDKNEKSICGLLDVDLLERKSLLKKLNNYIFKRNQLKIGFLKLYVKIYNHFVKVKTNKQILKDKKEEKKKFKTKKQLHLELKENKRKEKFEQTMENISFGF